MSRNLQTAEVADDRSECPADLGSCLSAVQMQASTSRTDRDESACRPIIARRYNHHPWPDSRTHRPLPSRHVTCPTSIHYFRSVTRRRSAAVLCYSPSSVYFRFRSKSGEALSGIRTHSSSTTSNFDICGPKTRLHAGASTVSQESRLVTPAVTLTDRERWNLRYRCTFTPLCSYGCYRSSWSRLVSDLRPTTTHVTSSSQRGEAKLHSDRFGLRWR